MYFYFLEIFLRFNCFPNWSHRSSLWAMIQFSCFRINFLSCNFSLTGISSKHSWPSDTIIKAQKWLKLAFIHLIIFLKTILCQNDSLFHQLSQNVIKYLHSIYRIHGHQAIIVHFLFLFYTDSLDSIPSPSPSVKIQIIGGKVYLR